MSLKKVPSKAADKIAKLPNGLRNAAGISLIATILLGLGAGISYPRVIREILSRLNDTRARVGRTTGGPLTRIKINEQDETKDPEEVIRAFEQQGFKVKVVNQDPQTQVTDLVLITTGPNDPVLTDLVRDVVDEEYGQPEERETNAKQRISLYYNTHTGRYTAVVKAERR